MGRPIQLVTISLLILAPCLHESAAAAERVVIHFDVPDGLQGYSGQQPVTFGVPFPPGVLKRSDGLRVVDEKGRRLPGQFEITATWRPAGDDIRWLLIDCVADVRDGAAPPLFLEFGSDVESPPEAPEGEFGPPAGAFTLVAGNGKAYEARIEKTTVEVPGAVRREVKSEGRYVAADGTSIAEFVTRVRRYRGQPFIRVYHTMIWQSGPEPKLGQLSFVPAGHASPATATVGVDGRAISVDSGSTLRQIDWNRVLGAQGRQLDGWIECSGRGENVFAALRWPWQQFPISFGTSNGKLEIGLIAPEKPMSLKPDALAVGYVIPEKAKWNLRVFDRGPLWSMKYNGLEALPHLSPRGAAKTFELLLWSGDPDIDPGQKNLLAQHPVLGFAEPEFVTRANLPSPMSPRDAKRFPEIEDGLERAFDWVARENAFDGDYGTWTFGDIQWAWVGSRGYTTYRYWMNHGKGWSIVPWALWLRSGDRRYWEHGEANSRHCMDIDICHVPEWQRTDDFKIRGGQYHYSALQMGYGPEVATFFIDSEYLPYCYYTTGYRRAWDVTEERAEALVRDDFAERAAHFRENRESRSRHLYIMLKDLAVLYEATWHPELRRQLLTYLDLTLDAQMEDGNFLGVKNNHYLDQPLLLAARVLPEKRPRILEALRRWRRYQGDALEIESGRGGTGPWSLWTQHALAVADRDPAMHAENVRLARTQALAIGDDDNEWHGLAPFEAHVAGPILRDWVVAMSGQAEGEPTTALSPMLHFNARLPDDRAEGTAGGRSGRHVVLVLKTPEDPLTIDLHFSLHNMGSRQEHAVGIVGPDGAEVESRTFYTQKLQQPDDQQGIRLTVSRERPAGVYALVLRSVAPICAAASSGKVVHYMPEGRRAFTSARWGGQAWFMPRGDGEVVISHQPNVPQERVVALGPDGKIIATSRITGTKEIETPGGVRQLPVGEPCRFTPAAADLHSFVSAAGDWHSTRSITGTLPWFAARRAEWFDPQKHPMPDLDAVLQAR